GGDQYALRRSQSLRDGYVIVVYFDPHFGGIEVVVNVNPTISQDRIDGLGWLKSDGWKNPFSVNVQDGGRALCEPEGYIFRSTGQYCRHKGLGFPERQARHYREGRAGSQELPSGDVHNRSMGAI
ncbi:hypothetical protein LCGC14_1831340, partial [marine sediment metagenome]